MARNSKFSVVDGTLTILSFGAKWNGGCRRGVKDLPEIQEEEATRLLIWLANENGMSDDKELVL